MSPLSGRGENPARAMLSLEGFYSAGGAPGWGRGFRAGGLQWWEGGGRGVDSALAACVPPCRTGFCSTVRFQSEHLLEGTEQRIPSR